MVKNTLRNLTLSIFLVTLSVACATGPVDPENSPYYKIPAGSSLVLHSELQIPANKAAVFIQDGAVKNFKDMDKYYPYCKFEVRTIKDTNQTIRTDSFIIHRATTDENIVQNQPSLLRRVSLNGSGPSFIEMLRLMYLSSEQQPDVYRLTCEHRAISPDYYHLTVSQIRKTLGKLMSLKLNQPG